MVKDTGIQWADSTFNPWQGCSKGAQGLWVLPAGTETLLWLDLAESDLAIKLKGVQS